MSALLYWTCGKEMADMLLANGDAKEAEKLIRSQIADFKYKFSKNQDVWASTYLTQSIMNNMKGFNHAF